MTKRFASTVFLAMTLFGCELSIGGSGQGVSEQDTGSSSTGSNDGSGDLRPCEELATEQACAAREDCEPLYDGFDCSGDCGSAGGSNACSCASYEFTTCAGAGQGSGCFDSSGSDVCGSGDGSGDGSGVTGSDEGSGSDSDGGSAWGSGSGSGATSIGSGSGSGI